MITTSRSEYSDSSRILCANFSAGPKRVASELRLVESSAARSLGLSELARRTACAPVEKSGQDEFDFEHGDEFGARLDEAAPTFAKALVRYNPEGDRQTNETQRRRLKSLSDYAHSRDYRFMFELLVPATESQRESVAQDSRAYDL
ncbi:MAG: DUF2090 domain-containing protein, partial [Gemmatimonadetes bacterium]|nr:DUF2090 domain-containing protein [Gemmatimonadota bacterium]